MSGTGSGSGYGERIIRHNSRDVWEADSQDLLIPVGCKRGVCAALPVGAAPQTWRVVIGPAEAIEMMLKAAKTVVENEQCILKFVFWSWKAENV